MTTVRYDDQPTVHNLLAHSLGHVLPKGLTSSATYQQRRAADILEAEPEVERLGVRRILRQANTLNLGLCPALASTLNALECRVSVNEKVDADLARAYERTLYDVQLPDGTVTLLVRRAPLGNSGPIRDRRLAIVTAYNPGYERPDDAANRAANERLRAEIERRGWAWCEATGYSPERDHREPSFAIFDVSDDEAVEIGRQFGQAAIFAWDGRRGRIAWCTGP